MRKIRLGAAVGAALLISIPVAAEAATPTAPTTSTPTAPAPSTSTSQTSTSQTSTSAPSTSTSKTSTAPSTSTSQTSTQSPTAPKSASTTSGTTTTPPPPGTSEAYALVLGSFLALSHTKASASGSGTSSTADPLELGGPNPPATQFGGTQNGQGSISGALFDTSTYNPSNQFRLALTPWTASNTQGTDQNTADAMSDIVLLDLGDQTSSQSASVRVLQSKSHAQWTPAASSGNSSADGAIVTAGGPSGLNIDLLHSESSSSGAGSSYLLSVNGNKIGSSDQVNGQCQIPLSPLLVINCLTSTGGVAGNITNSGADVVTATLGPGSQQSLTGKLIDSSTKAGTAPPAVSSGNGGQTAGSGTGAGTGSGNGAAAPSGALAFTGLDAASLLALALALGLGGAGLVWWARRSRVSVI